MNTIGYLFLFLGAFLIRGIAKGRVRELPSDIADAFTAAVSGDGESLSGVLARTGEGLSSTAPVDSDTASTGEGPTGDSLGAGLLASARQRGKGATYSQVARLGPKSYDCSGLVYMSMKDNGYSGGNFWTGNFRQVAKKYITKIPKEQAAVNDIVIWVGHMGIVSGSDMFYSALSKRSGIKEMKISSHKSGGTPEYYRFSSSEKPVGIGVLK